MDIFLPIHNLSEYVAFDILKLNPNSYWGSSVSYFLFDIIRIGILLIIINYIMAITRHYFPTEKIKNMLTNRKWYGADYLLAGVLGMVTPFCSCSSIPLFVGFLSAGIPIGVTFTFLIASPLINESSLILFPAMFGVKTAIIYNLTGLSVAMAGGYLIEKLKMERFINKDLFKFTKSKMGNSKDKDVKENYRKLTGLWWKESMQLTKTLFPYILFGVTVGALIHGFVPETFVEKYLSFKGWWSVPLATLLGVPFYANSVSVIPVIEVLIEKGIPLGTALSFMTAVVTLSVPEALMLKKVMKTPLLITFFAVTIMGIMLIGFLFNLST